MSRDWIPVRISSSEAGIRSEIGPRLGTNAGSISIIVAAVEDEAEVGDPGTGVEQADDMAEDDDVDSGVLP